jgi:hypothetical protein
MRAALDHAATGFFVFPLWPHSKKPAIREWETAASREPANIHSWWANVPYNIGVACGPSGLHVLDLDDADGRQPPARWAGATHGRDVLARLAAEHSQPMPTNTRIVATATGWHLW